MPRGSALSIALCIGVLAGISGFSDRLFGDPPSTAADAAKYPYAIEFVIDSASFQPGDKIVITSVRGTQPHIGLGGSYLVKGTYTLGSCEGATLALSLTAQSKDSPGARVPWSQEQVVPVSLGSGRFLLKATMQYPGSYHVSFYNIRSSFGGIYFREEKFGPVKTPDLTIIDTVGLENAAAENPTKQP